MISKMTEPEASTEPTCPHPKVQRKRWRPCELCRDEITWHRGDCFAFVFADNDVLYGEVLRVLSEEFCKVRVYCESESTSVVEKYRWTCMSCRLTRGQMDRAARLRWPRTVEGLYAILHTEPHEVPDRPSARKERER